MNGLSGSFWECVKRILYRVLLSYFSSIVTKDLEISTNTARMSTKQREFREYMPSKSLQGHICYPWKVLDEVKLNHLYIPCLHNVPWSTEPRSHQHTVPRTQPQRTQLGTEDEIVALLSNGKGTMDGPLSFIYVLFSEDCEWYRNFQGLGENMHTMNINQICPISKRCFLINV